MFEDHLVKKKNMYIFDGYRSIPQVWSVKKVRHHTGIKINNKKLVLKKHETELARELVAIKKKKKKKKGKERERK